MHLPCTASGNRSRDLQKVTGLFPNRLCRILAKLVCPSRFDGSHGPSIHRNNHMRPNPPGEGDPVDLRGGVCPTLNGSNCWPGLSVTVIVQPCPPGARSAVMMRRPSLFMRSNAARNSAVVFVTICIFWSVFALPRFVSSNRADILPQNWTG